MAKLSKKQKAVIAQMAARAHKASRQDMPLADWRRQETHEVTGCASLTECHQRHYVPLFNHFAVIAGSKPKVDNTPTPHARAVWVLRNTMQRWEITPAYLHRIICDQFRPVPLGMVDAMCADLSFEEIRQLTYTATNRGRRRQRKAEEQHDLPRATEYHTSPSTVPPGGLPEHFGVVLVQPSAHRGRADRRPDADIAT